MVLGHATVNERDFVCDTKDFRSSGFHSEVSFSNEPRRRQRSLKRTAGGMTNRFQRLLQEVSDTLETLSIARVTLLLNHHT